MPDIWDPIESVGQLELDKDIPDYREFPDCEHPNVPMSFGRWSVGDT